MKIELSNDEALILYEWLASQEGPTYKVGDDAEQIVLWKVEGMLEKEVPMVFGDNYKDEINNAKNRISKQPKGA
jgi:hypothetical protein